MAPVAYGALASIAGMVVISTFAGVLIGTVFWNHSIRWGLFCVVAYLLLAPVLYEANPRATTALGAGPVMLTFLTSHLTARALHARGRGPLRASIAAACAGVLVAIVYLILFRLLFWQSFTMSSWIALAADVCLLAVAFRKRKAWAKSRQFA